MPELIAGLILLIGVLLGVGVAIWATKGLYGHWGTQEGLEGRAGADGETPAGDPGGAAGTEQGAVLTTADGAISARVGVIPAWRCWRVDGSYAGTTLVVRLVSHTRVEYWDGPVKVADVVPAPDNESGLYAAKHWESPILPCHTNAGDLRVFGRVGLYGIVVEGDRGYRAERAVIEELWLVDAAAYLRLFGAKQAALPLEMLEAALADRYQVEVHRGWPDGRLTKRLHGWFQP